MTIKPVAWTNEAQLGFVADTKWSGIPMAMWGERECYAQPDIALCHHDEAMAEVERLQAENATLRQQLAEARNKALDEACRVINKAFSEGSKIPSSTVPLFTGLRTAIRALKNSAP